MKSINSLGIAAMLLFAAGCHKENPTALAKPELNNQTIATIERTPTDSQKPSEPALAPAPGTTAAAKTNIPPVP